MSNLLLSIVVPSNRKALASLSAISMAISAVSDEIEVVICDDSGDLFKISLIESLIRNMENAKLIQNPSTTTAWENCQSGFVEARGSYLAFLGDDDYLDPDFFRAALALIKSGEESLCVFPRVVRNDPGKIPQVIIAPTGGDGVVNRVLEFQRKGCPPFANFAASPKFLWSRFFSYAKRHPFQPNYFDWFLDYFMRSNCVCKIADAGLYLYNAHNWSAAENAFSSDQKFWVNKGFPAWFVAFHHLIWAVDITLYVRSGYIKGSADEKMELMKFLFADKIRLWKFWMSNPILLDRIVIPAVVAEAATNLIQRSYIDFDGTLELVGVALENVNPSVHSRYFEYVTSMLQDIVV